VSTCRTGEQQGVDQDTGGELDREYDVEVARAGLLRAHQGLAHAAAGEIAGHPGKDLDGDQQAEVLRHQQARQDDPDQEGPEAAQHAAQRHPGGVPPDLCSPRLM
jgi:hypothetical protein